MAVRQHRDGCVTCHFQGAIAKLAEYQLRVALAQAPRPASLVLDLSGIFCVDDFGLDTLREWVRQTQQGGTKISLTASSAKLAELLNIADFDQSADLVPTAARAVHDLARASANADQ